MYLPTDRTEMQARGWDELDVILVSGDAYIDSPFIGVAVIGRVLENAGFRVGIIAQPDIQTLDDISRLGEPRLFWGVSGGCIDSMVANRTAAGKPRRQDDYTPGGRNDRRPDRAVIAYCNLIRRRFKNTCPLVLGGLEASLRRIAHYDYWSDSIRRSILADAKADFLLYGMAERSVLELANALRDGTEPRGIRGLCHLSRELPPAAIELPSFQECVTDKSAFTRMFHTFYQNNDPQTARPLAQLQDTRWLVQNPPAEYLSTEELDAVHELDFELDVPPSARAAGKVRALDTIRFAIATHRGCYGECNFCAISVHQGRTIRWRSKDSILREARRLAAQPQFKGVILDVGGPTANMYGFECSRKNSKAGACTHRRCLFPEVCPELPVDHQRQLELLGALRQIPGVKHVFVGSGLRTDLILADRKHGDTYLRQLVQHHISGQLKLAPEHSAPEVLRKMGKPGTAGLLQFRERFNRLNREEGQRQFLTYYLIAAHPGCTDTDMRSLRDFCTRELKLRPEQVQIFTPTPSTYSTLMYYTGRDPFTDTPCFVERTSKGRKKQRDIIQPPAPQQKRGKMVNIQ